MAHETFKKLTLKYYPGEYGCRPDWSNRSDISSYTTSLCPQGVRALLGKRLDRARTVEFRAYTKKPRTDVREVEVRCNDNEAAETCRRWKSFDWKVKGIGNFKFIPSGAEDFLRKQFASIEEMGNKEVKTIFIRAIQKEA